MVEATSGPLELPLPIRIVSDWHLGHPGAAIREIEQIAHELSGVGTLVMAGDGREELMRAWRLQGDKLWTELSERCEAMQIRLVALTGNHDPNVSGEGWLRLDEGRILVTHGDLIYETASPWSRCLFDKREEVESYLASHPADSLFSRWQNAMAVGRILRPSRQQGTSLLAYASQALWPPQRLVAIVAAFRGFVAECGRFLDRYAPEVEVIICGHFHRGGRFSSGGRRVLNTGSLMKFDRGYAVDFDGESLTLRRIRVRKVVLAAS